MSALDLEIVNIALSKVSADPITGFDDESIEAEIIRPLYNQIKRELLGAESWNFARTKRYLPRFNETPVADWKYAFAKPEDYVRLVRIGQLDERIGSLPYAIQGGKFFADEEEILLHYIRLADEEDMPPYFLAALRLRLEAEFVMPLGSESVNEANARLQVARDELIMAKERNAAEQDPETLDPGSALISVRG